MKVQHILARGEMLLAKKEALEAAEKAAQAAKKAAKEKAAKRVRVRAYDSEMTPEAILGSSVEEVGGDYAAGGGIVITKTTEGFIVNGETFGFNKVFAVHEYSGEKHDAFLTTSTVHAIKAWIDGEREYNSVKEMHENSPNSGWVYSASSFRTDVFQYASFKEAYEKEGSITHYTKDIPVK